MTSWLKRGVIGALLGGSLVVLANCGGGDEAEQKQTLCRPRLTVFCRCQNGDPGWQTCNDDGSAFDDCAPCDNDSDAGGGAFCGNNQLEGQEECDDGNLENNDACTTECRKARCGDGIVRDGSEQCDDANDVDTDGCSNNCTSAALEADQCPGLSVALRLGRTPTVGGDLSVSKPDTTGSCGGDGADAYYSFTAPTNGQVAVGASTTGGADLVLYVRDGDCQSGPEVGCSNNGAAGSSELVLFAAQKDKTYVAVVDQNGSTGGAISLTLQITPDVPCEGEGTSCETDQPGICAAGALVCTNNTLDCVQAKQKQPSETCGNGLDDDCNGVVDNGCPCTHDVCAPGAALATDCDSCVSQICNSDPFCCKSTGTWDDLCIGKVASVCGSGKCKLDCSHSICSEGAPLVPGCDGAVDCVSDVCGFDPVCCSGGWDDLCVSTATQVCGLTCN